MNSKEFRWHAAAVDGEGVPLHGGCLYLIGKRTDGPCIEGGSTDGHSLREFEAPDGIRFAPSGNCKGSYGARCCENFESAPDGRGPRHKPERTSQIRNRSPEDSC